MVLFFFVILFHYLHSKVYNQVAVNNKYTLELENFKTSLENFKEKSNASFCEIKKYPINNDFPELKNPYRSPKCFKSFTNNYVYFKNGFVRYKNKNPIITCKYQCNYLNGETKIRMGPWKDINRAKPDCDVFEIKCTTSFWPHIVVFRDLYLQVIKQEKKEPEEVTFLKDFYNISDTNNKYNVHLIILDSISYYSAIRGFKKTMNYLENEYSAVTFKMHNKVGSNSQPNGHGFLLNKRINKLQNFLNLRETKDSDYEIVGETGCKENLDHQPIITKYYRQLNYTIFSGEDFPDTVFTSHYCKGFKKHYAHHSSRPYVLKLYNQKYFNHKLFLNIHQSKCKGNVVYQFDYLSEFMKTYNDSKQFTYTWITRMAHSRLTGHYEYDDYFRNFFTSNKELFNNGFLILMSDHGFRIGKYRHSEIGAFEDKNPFLIIAPPKELRKNDSEVLNNLKVNSNKHTSHFDIYATMVDILTEGSRTNFKNMSYFNFTEIIKNNTIKGASLLREIKEERNCYSMEISSDYCLCTEKDINYNKSLTTSVMNDNSLTNKSGAIEKFLKERFINELNNQLKLYNLTKHCQKMSENKNGVFHLKYFYTNGKVIFFLRQEVLPKGLFEGYFNEDGKMISTSIERLDRYGPYADMCLPNHPYKMYCYCKKLIGLVKKNIFQKMNDNIKNIF